MGSTEINENKNLTKVSSPYSIANVSFFVSLLSDDWSQCVTIYLQVAWQL